jgi:signal transduction histidine kinase
MTLTKRITFLVVGLLTIGAIGSSVTFFVAVHRSLKGELQKRLEARVLWMETSIEVEDERLLFGPVQEAKGAAPLWQVTGPDGKVLWGSKDSTLRPPVVTKSKILVLGKPDWPMVSNGELHPGPAADKPSAELLYQMKDLMYFPSYALPKERKRLDLTLTTWDSSATMHSTEGLIGAVLWGVGPLALVGIALLFALVIRWQLKPLGEMAKQAGSIGPDNVSSRIDPAGSSAECIQLRDAINMMIERLAEGLKREKHFASMAAHELRTPLAQLRTHLEVSLRKDRPLQEYRGALAYSLTDVDRLQKLIQGLLQLTRATDTGKVPGRPVLLWPLLRRAQQDFAPIALAQPGDTEDVLVSGEDELFYSAIGNVLENASRYAPGAPAEVCVMREGTGVRLIVSDHGPGVPENEREKIFAPLVRLDQARTIGDGHGGFGLGLTIARTTVRSFGGDLVCRARRDGTPGAEFVFTMATPQAPGAARAG